MIVDEYESVICDYSQTLYKGTVIQVTINLSSLPLIMNQLVYNSDEYTTVSKPLRHASMMTKM